MPVHVSSCESSLVATMVRCVGHTLLHDLLVSPGAGLSSPNLTCVLFEATAHRGDAHRSALHGATLAAQALVRGAGRARPTHASNAHYGWQARTHTRTVTQCAAPQAGLGRARGAPGRRQSGSRQPTRGRAAARRVCVQVRAGWPRQLCRDCGRRDGNARVDMHARTLPPTRCRSWGSSSSKLLPNISCEAKAGGAVCVSGGGGTG
jgi:hypothetical protein